LSCAADQNTQTENTDNQALTLLENSDTLSLENGGTVNLSKYLDNTDTQLTDTEISGFGYIKASEISGSETDPKLFEKNLDKITVTNDGNVGIGTTAPIEKLHVSGNIAFSGTLKKTGAEMRCGAGEVLVGFGNDGPICETAKSVSGGVAVWQ